MKRFMKVSMNLVAVVVILFSNGLPMKVNAFEANDSLLTKKVIVQNLNDDLKQSKISVPGAQLFKKADNEIIAQMNEQIADLYNFKWISFGFEKADETIQTSFYNSFKVSQFNNIDKSDDLINNSFRLENINRLSYYTFEKADNHINYQFHLKD
jgi:hypothetical protein